MSSFFRFNPGVTVVRAGLVPLALLSLAPTVLASESQGWKPASVSPQTIARNVDNKLRSLQGIKLEYEYGFKALGQCVTNCVCLMGTPRKFRLEYPRINLALMKENRTLSPEETQEARQVEDVLVISDGQRIAARIEPNGEPRVKSFPGDRRLPSSLLSNWFYDFPHIVLTAVGTSDSPLSALVAEARAKPGYKVGSEVRTLLFHGRKITSYRITVKKAASGKSPSIFYEVVVDSTRWLPTTFNNTEETRTLVKKGRKPKLSIETSGLTAKWTLRRVTFGPSDFSIDSMR